jgi:hypothetical protein
VHRVDATADCVQPSTNHDMITYVQQARSAYHAARRVGEIIADSGAIDIFCLNMSDRRVVGKIYKAHSRNRCLSFEEVLDMALKFAQEDILVPGTSAHATSTLATTSASGKGVPASTTT